MAIKRKFTQALSSELPPCERVHANTYHDTKDLTSNDFVENLLAWYGGVKSKRRMPWRKDFDSKWTAEEQSQRAYEVLVSEIMLQQTQVETVKPYYERWTNKWPTVNNLAKATIDEVNEVWTGLGYYSRARRLLESAQIVAKDLGGLLPTTSRDLEKQLPGVGRYTAGAVASIAYNHRVSVLDGNVHRVLSRQLAMHANQQAKSTLDFLWRSADELVVTTESPGDFNQALMELGASVCTFAAPKCGDCPVSASCKALVESSRSSSKVGVKAKRKPASVDMEDLCTLCVPIPAAEVKIQHFPMAKVKKLAREEAENVSVIRWTPKSPTEGEENARYLIIKRPAKGLLGGLWALPSTPLPAPDDPAFPSRREELSTKLLSALLGDGILLPKTAAPPHLVVATRTFEDESTPHKFTHIAMQYYTETVNVVGGHDPPSLLVAAARGREDSRECKWVTGNEALEVLSTGFKKVLLRSMGVGVKGARVTRPAGKAKANVKAKKRRVGGVE